jgi:uncharacterized protein YciI
MDSQHTILAQIEAEDPELAQRLVSRRDAIRQGASVSSGLAAALALGSVPVALAAISRDVFGQTPSTVQSTLNFALMLEIFENELYRAVLGTSAVAAQNAAFAPVRALVPASALPALQKIQQHEAQHVAFLTSNGAQNVLSLTGASFDFTGNRGGATPGPFARATTELAFLLLVAQAVEDTGVRAYKGQAPNLKENSVVLEAALRIHSVEARHASKIRRLRRATGAPATVKYSGTIAGGGAAAAGASNVANPPQAVVDALGLIYGGEENTAHAGLNLTSLSLAGTGLPSGAELTQAASEAFDEPLSRATVTTIVQPFFVPTIPTS